MTEEGANPLPMHARHRAAAAAAASAAHATRRRRGRSSAGADAGGHQGLPNLLVAALGADQLLLGRLGVVIGHIVEPVFENMALAARQAVADHPALQSKIGYGVI